MTCPLCGVIAASSCSIIISWTALNIYGQRKLVLKTCCIKIVEICGSSPFLCFCGLDHFFSFSNFWFFSDYLWPKLTKHSTPWNSSSQIIKIQHGIFQEPSVGQATWHCFIESWQARQFDNSHHFWSVWTQQITDTSVHKIEQGGAMAQASLVTFQYFFQSFFQNFWHVYVYFASVIVGWHLAENRRCCSCCRPCINLNHLTHLKGVAIFAEMLRS